MKRLFTFIAAIAAFVIAASAALPSDVIVILGDSNTSIGGDDCSDPKAWSKTFADSIAPASIRSYARSGATWTNTATTKRNTIENIGVLGPDNTIYNQVERLGQAIADGSQAKPSVIIVMAGTNDAWFHRRRPGAFDTSAAQAMATPDDDELLIKAPSAVRSLARSVRQDCLRLRMIAPGATIVLVGPLQSVQADDNMIIAASGIIADVGAAMGIPVIRLDTEFPLSSAEEAKTHRLTSDGTHTSPEGARQLGAFLARRIEAIAGAR